MAIIISLREMVDEMQTLSNEIRTYLNVVTGKFVTILPDDQFLEREEDPSDLPEWQQERLKDVKDVSSSHDFKEIPNQFDIHEYDIMENFCMSIDDGQTRDTLLRAIRGSGAFRRFKETISRYGIEEEWFNYKDQAYKEIAIDWLERKEIAYKDDV